MPLLAAWIVHLMLSLLYSLVVARMVSGFRKGHARFSRVV
jgi:hypothetical protein